MEKDNGGPAFPMELDQITPQVGMTLRDYFAAAALTGLVLNYNEHGSAERAYRYADAMLEARK